jgi:OOP family OmpA-OmpF porin
MTKPIRSFTRRSLPALAAFAMVAAAPAQALEVLGFYVGVGAGQSQVRGDIDGVSTASFKENHSAFKAFVGVRPISLLGAEAAYIDFGNPSGTVAGQTVEADLKGLSLMGLVYLPLPLPFIDVYGKAGYTRVDGDIAVRGAPLLRGDLDANAFTAGAGVQVKFASWAVRGEYERFSASGDDPSLWTVSLAKTFF